MAGLVNAFDLIGHGPMGGNLINAAQAAGDTALLARIQAAAEAGDRRELLKILSENTRLTTAPRASASLPAAPAADAPAGRDPVAFQRRVTNDPNISAAITANADSLPPDLMQRVLAGDPDATIEAYRLSSEAAAQSERAARQASRQSFDSADAFGGGTAAVGPDEASGLDAVSDFPPLEEVGGLSVYGTRGPGVAVGGGPMPQLERGLTTDVNLPRLGTSAFTLGETMGPVPPAPLRLESPDVVSARRAAEAAEANRTLSLDELLARLNPRTPVGSGGRLGTYTIRGPLADSVQDVMGPGVDLLRTEANPIRRVAELPGGTSEVINRPAQEIVTQIDAGGPTLRTPERVDYTDPLNPPPRTPWVSNPPTVTGRTLTQPPGASGNPTLAERARSMLGSRSAAGTAIAAAMASPLLARMFGQPQAPAAWQEPEPPAPVPVTPSDPEPDMPADPEFVPFSAPQENLEGAPAAELEDAPPQTPEAVDEMVRQWDDPVAPEPAPAPASKPPARRTGYDIARKLQTAREVLASGGKTAEEIRNSPFYDGLPEDLLDRAIARGTELRGRKDRVKMLGMFGGNMPGRRAQAAQAMNTYLALDPENRDAWLMEQNINPRARGNSVALAALARRQESEDKLKAIEALGTNEMNRVRLENEGRLEVADRQALVADKDRDSRERLGMAGLAAEDKKLEAAKAQAARAERMEIARGNWQAAQQWAMHRETLQKTQVDLRLKAKALSMTEQKNNFDMELEKPKDLLDTAQKTAVSGKYNELLGAAQRLRQRGLTREQVGTTLRRDQRFFIIDDPTLSRALNTAYAGR